MSNSLALLLVVFVLTATDIDDPAIQTPDMVLAVPAVTRTDHLDVSIHELCRLGIGAPQDQRSMVSGE